MEDVVSTSDEEKAPPSMEQLQKGYCPVSRVLFLEYCLFRTVFLCPVSFVLFLRTVSSVMFLESCFLSTVPRVHIYLVLFLEYIFF